MREAQNTIKNAVSVNAADMASRAIAMDSHYLGVGGYGGLSSPGYFPYDNGAASSSNHLTPFLLGNAAANGSPFLSRRGSSHYHPPTPQQQHFLGNHLAVPNGTHFLSTPLRTDAADRIIRKPRGETRER